MSDWSLVDNQGKLWPNKLVHIEKSFCECQFNGQAMLAYKPIWER